MKVSEKPIIGFLLFQLLYDLVYFNSHLTEVQIEVLYMVPDYLLKIWVALIIADQVKGSRGERLTIKGVIYAICGVWGVAALINIIGLAAEDYRSFRELVNHQVITNIMWGIVFIYLLKILFSYAGYQKNR